MQTWADIAFADGEYRFALGLQQISELEKKCDAGLGRIYARTLAARFGLKPDEVVPTEAEYRFSELVEVIRQGLIGGGQGQVDGSEVKVSSIRANELVNAYLLTPATRNPVRETWALAAAILSALIEGYSPPKDEPAAAPVAQTTGSTTRRRSRTAPK